MKPYPLIPVFFTTAILLLGLALSPSRVFAESIQRLADCEGDAKCAEQYTAEKERWKECLKIAELSDRKIEKLSRRVERMGIRNLKKQEFLILVFDSARKQCHVDFKNALGALEKPKESDPLQKPPPLDYFEKRLDPSDPK